MDSLDDDEVLPWTPLMASLLRRFLIMAPPSWRNNSTLNSKMKVGESAYVLNHFLGYLQLYHFWLTLPSHHPLRKKLSIRTLKAVRDAARARNAFMEFAVAINQGSTKISLPSPACPPGTPTFTRQFCRIHPLHILTSSDHQVNPAAVRRGLPFVILNIPYIRYSYPTLCAIPGISDGVVARSILDFPACSIGRQLMWYAQYHQTALVTLLKERESITSATQNDTNVSTPEPNTMCLFPSAVPGDVKLARVWEAYLQPTRPLAWFFRQGHEDPIFAQANVKLMHASIQAQGSKEHVFEFLNRFLLDTYSLKNTVYDPTKPGALTDLDPDNVFFQLSIRGEHSSILASMFYFYMATHFIRSSQRTYPTTRPCTLEMLMKDGFPKLNVAEFTAWLREAKPSRFRERGVYATTAHAQSSIDKSDPTMAINSPSSGVTLCTFNLTGFKQFLHDQHPGLALDAECNLFRKLISLLDRKLPV